MFLESIAGIRHDAMSDHHFQHASHHHSHTMRNFSGMNTSVRSRYLILLFGGALFILFCLTITGYRALVQTPNIFLIPQARCGCLCLKYVFDFFFQLILATLIFSENNSDCVQYEQLFARAGLWCPLLSDRLVFLHFFMCLFCDFFL